jgi:Fe2+ or Zn2+ uptake regulation protein
MQINNQAYDRAKEFIKENNLRFSRQRMITIAEMFFNLDNQKHFRLIELHELINKNHLNAKIDLGTLSNLLKGLVNAGKIQAVYTNKTFYDVNILPHSHFYDRTKDEIIDVYQNEHLEYLQQKIIAPKGYDLENINCIFDIAKSKNNSYL